MLKEARRRSIRSIAWLTAIVAIDATTAYCQPNSTCDASRKMNDSETDREAVSSRGTGLSSAEMDAAANSSTPTRAPVLMLPCAIEMSAATTTGTEVATTADVYRNSPGGYVGADGEASSLTIPTDIGCPTTPLEPRGRDAADTRPTCVPRLG